MIATLARGILRIAAASSGLLLVFGVVYAMEGMTTRLPTTSFRELVGSTAFMVPWALLFCSGFDDLTRITRRPWLFWTGTVLVLALVYYLDRGTSLQGFNKVAMPVLASSLAIQPHLFRRVALLYSLASVVIGLCGVLVLFNTVQLLLRGGTFTNLLTAVYVLCFSVSSIAAAVLSIRRRGIAVPREGESVASGE
jgi:hypothetical protein